MNSSPLLSNILNPPVLFFFLGMLAIFLQSDLEIPQPLPKLFSLYLLLAIGFKGGYEIEKSAINPEIVLTLLAAIFMASVVPIYSFFILKLKLDTYNAAAIAATYGSISAVTFITAQSFLKILNIDSSGHMVAALALMESPAIIVGIVLVRFFAKSQLEAGEGEAEKFSWGEVLREAFLNGSVFLLIGSVIVGILTGEKGWEKLHPFTQDIFYGVLSFFLLDMGMVAARRIKDLRNTGIFLIAFGIFMPVFNAMIGIFISKLIGMSEGNALLFAVLCASASYIAVPAAMRMTVPEANPSLYVSMALAITFPFNIIVGIPLYFNIIKTIGV
ncbi:sodium-dependent bicarbonate transport family permease [Aphanizomenon sp. PH219]|uniref:Sodium-dependent bicarbonate transport family permease n=1 Tax=Dolichospermum heterosporum TAC447 TaxID=747523 RepID=A0ABY5M126_9CYAN|nr:MULTISPECIES: sodium-dependent bicarbonate transport family permease [Aphanizomenonaceae]MDK2408485.1 sodium-dependent bicarbonate transport family permease [Aphanizomenon sp. 202]MDK2458587.1 sodium-dependent bicarbonate transport family permease [Aphanizomenon sp. PH219]UUO16558.1 sodium-dependent bicarbonate transport family permease [Dolichospermum heterosporum TAC447]